MITHERTSQKSTDPATLARNAINVILDGNEPDDTDPNQLGKFGECYQEMIRAYETGGTGAARQVFVAYAEYDHEVAALRAADPDPRKQEWSVADLLTTEFPEPKWAIPDLLPSGFVVLAGRPKLGKSWLALQMAVAVGSGGTIFGHQVERGRVLYLALEDNARRLQDRLRKQHATNDTDITFVFEWEPLAGQGTADLMAAVNEHEYQLIVVDTISRALGRADQMDLADMNVVMGTIQRLAVEREITILSVDHHRKSAAGAGDVIDDVMGSSSKSAVADAAMGLYRERGQSNATLKVSGRDINDQELALQFDVNLFSWQLVGIAAGVRSESVQAEILDALEELGGIGTVSRVASWLNRDKSNVRKEMLELVAKGAVTRGEKDGKEVPYTLLE